MLLLLSAIFTLLLQAISSLLLSPCCHSAVQRGEPLILLMSAARCISSSICTNVNIFLFFQRL
nr:MAG TPA: hypothetical protein [Caudoviricetes sp.]